MLDSGRSSLKRRQKTETELREGRIRTSQGLPCARGGGSPMGDPEGLTEKKLRIFT